MTEQQAETGGSDDGATSLNLPGVWSAEDVFKVFKTWIGQNKPLLVYLGDGLEAFHGPSAIETAEPADNSTREILWQCYAQWLDPIVNSAQTRREDLKKTIDKKEAPLRALVRIPSGYEDLYRRDFPDTYQTRTFTLETSYIYRAQWPWAKGRLRLPISSQVQVNEVEVLGALPPIKVGPIELPLNTKLMISNGEEIYFALNKPFYDGFGHYVSRPSRRIRKHLNQGQIWTDQPLEPKTDQDRKNKTPNEGGDHV